MGSRREAREIALQVLYLNDTCGMSPEAALKSTTLEPTSETIIRFSHHLVEGVFSRKDEIDLILSRYIENWDITRIAIVDRNILRLSTFEILTDTQTPISVIINEAIEIAKMYSTADSGKFVNGILDKIKQERKNEPVL